MTIRRRLNLSFASLILLFAATIFVYLWSAHLRTLTMERLDRSLNRQVTLGRIQQDIDNLHKEVALLNNLATESDQSSPNSSARDLFDEKLNDVTTEIEQFKKLRVAGEGSLTDELDSTYAIVAQSWRAFYDQLGREQSWAIANAAKADAFSYKLLMSTLPQMQEAEKQRVQNDEADFARVGKLTTRLNAIAFSLFVLVAVVVAFVISRSIVRGFAALQNGADLIGNMNLEHRIHLQTRDELGRFAQTFRLSSMSLCCGLPIGHLEESQALRQCNPSRLFGGGDSTRVSLRRKQ